MGLFCLFLTPSVFLHGFCTCVLPFSHDLFIPPRNLTIRFPKQSEQLINLLLSRVRLKRKIPVANRSSSVASHLNPINLLPPASTIVPSSSSSSSPSASLRAGSSSLSGASCVFSSYLVCLCRFISLSIESIHLPKHRSTIVTTKQMIDDYNTSDLPVNVTRGRENSILERKRHGSEAHYSVGGSGGGLKSFTSYSPHKILESAVLALRVGYSFLFCSSTFSYFWSADHCF
jgi:hypothetical protein